MRSRVAAESPAGARRRIVAPAPARTPTCRRAGAAAQRAPAAAAVVAAETLSRQLASLSAKFVEDYAPLTDKLREVVQISKGL